MRVIVQSLAALATFFLAMLVSIAIAATIAHMSRATMGGSTVVFRALAFGVSVYLAHYGWHYAGVLYDRKRMWSQ